MSNVRVTVNLSETEVLAIQDMARKRGTTCTAVITQCIGTEKYISDKIASGAKVLLEELDGTMKQLVFSL